MSIEIKFRALKDDHSDYQFVYGDLIRDSQGIPRIQTNNEETFFTTCIKGTEGQYTGLKNNGKEIYAGDIFRQEEETDEGDIRTYLIVTYVRQRGAFYLVPSAHYPILRDNDCEDEENFQWLFQEASLYDFSIDIGLPLVGNIHQDKHLIE